MRITDPPLNVRRHREQLAPRRAPERAPERVARLAAARRAARHSSEDESFPNARERAPEPRQAAADDSPEDGLSRRVPRCSDELSPGDESDDEELDAIMLIVVFVTMLFVRERAKGPPRVALRRRTGMLTSPAASSWTRADRTGTDEGFLVLMNVH